MIIVQMLQVRISSPAFCVGKWLKSLNSKAQDKYLCSFDKSFINPGEKQHKVAQRVKATNSQTQFRLWEPHVSGLMNEQMKKIEHCLDTVTWNIYFFNCSMNNSEFSSLFWGFWFYIWEGVFQRIQKAHVKLEGILDGRTVYGWWSMPVSAAFLFRIPELDI